MATQHSKSRLKRGTRWLAAAAAVGLVGGGVVGAVGDFGFTQRVFNGIEHRALQHQTTRLDRWGLQVFYAALRLSGRVLYPQAARLLTYYCEGRGDTLRIETRPLLRHPEVQQALRLHKPGITFRHQRSASPFYVARHTDWELYYAVHQVATDQHCVLRQLLLPALGAPVLHPVSRWAGAVAGERWAHPGSLPTGQGIRCLWQSCHGPCRGSSQR